MGHNSFFVDTGILSEAEGQKEAIPGQVDNRGGSVVKSEKPEIALFADIIIGHTGIPDNWIVKTTAPIIWIMHGRPGACFKPEQFGRGWSYSLINEIAQWPRIKAMLSFWPQHVNYWKVIIPENKIVCFNYPPIDEKRFCNSGSKYDFAGKNNRFNIVVSESLREDVDTFELMHGVIEYAKSNKGFYIHIFGLDPPLRCWELIIKELRRLDILGVIWQRRTDMEEVYRAADLVLSPQRIVTRSVGEALSCGTPVIAAYGCDLATYTTKIDEPKQVAETIDKALNDLTYNKEYLDEKVKYAAEALSLPNYNKKMNELYEQIV